MEIDYKKKYYGVLAALWIVMIIGGIFFYNIHKKLNVLNKDIRDFKMQEITEMYIDSGWMPPYEFKKVKRRKLKMEKDK